MFNLDDQTRFQFFSRHSILQTVLNTLYKTKTLLCICLLTVLSSACTTGPENNEWVDPFDLNFYGYAENPSATIQLQSFNKSTGTWVTVASATSSASGFTLGGDTLYSWSLTNFDFIGTVPSSTCYWGTPCAIPPGSASARFRFKEVGSLMAYLVTFDEGGIECVLDGLTAGDTWMASGANCRSTSSPVLTLKWLT